MKIFLDGNIFGQQKIGGISRLGFELIKELSKKGDVEQIFYRGLYIDDYPFKRNWFKKYYGFRRLPFFNRFFNFLDQTLMEIVYRLNNSPDIIFHSLYYRVPKNHKSRVVVHVYDMIQELFGAGFKTINFKKKSFDRADLIISISESTKKDLCKIYSIDPEKVIVAYPGVNSIFLKPVIAPLGPKKRAYMLYVGARNSQYKNFDLFFNAFISKKYFFNFDLVLVGGEKEITVQQKEKVKASPGNGKWIIHEFCDDRRLAELYSGATLFVYPSLYEGFGIPPIEAMACGCPVVASNTSSIPEVVGDAALLFNPKDRDELISKIEKILTDESFTLNLIEKGRARAKMFSWKSMADTIYNGYKKIL